MCFKKNKNYIFEEDLYKTKKVALFNKVDYVDAEESFQNPFLSEQDRAFSVEDYPVDFKEGLFKKPQKVYLGSVIRNQFISKRKRFKAFKRTLKGFKKDYYNQIENITSEKENEQFIYENIKVKKLSKGYKKSLFFVVLLNIIIILVCKLFFEKLFNELPFVLLMGCSYGLLIAFFIYLIIYKMKSSNVNNIQKRQLRKIGKIFRKEKKHFKKFYKKIYEYYYDNIYSDYLYYPSMVFDDFWKNKYNYIKVLESKENIQKNNIQLLRNLKKFHILSVIILVLSIINIIALLTVIVIKLI